MKNSEKKSDWKGTVSIVVAIIALLVAIFFSPMSRSESHQILDDNEEVLIVSHGGDMISVYFEDMTDELDEALDVMIDSKTIRVKKIIH